MLQRREYGEEHPERICCYCGNWADTGDHVPSKVFMDKPYPDNLPVVPCCKKCNEEFPYDEEYVAVLLECVRWQTFNLEEFKREKVRKIVEHNPAILKTVRESVHPMLDGRFTIDPDNVRLRKVLTKLILVTYVLKDWISCSFMKDWKYTSIKTYIRIESSMRSFNPQSTLDYYQRLGVGL